MDRLPQFERMLLSLRYGSGWSVEQIAAKIDGKPETVRSYINQALDKARELVDALDL